ncbi:MarR family transcriptional regulator [Protaetiibacter sp. SSC-01]|uniref:GbsR/MarR family transcriptional regulator n=1 Tax=Protaetiibacter sp. SSC-01 TaxID=2759943 RepID=UPI0016574A9B|nr:MarR family transcriptional regulator [Protaetiibacter sp. SSC-01]QNO36708.1 MarR family transcriptional regulator [Protaetiibacter sp. SSC-01]
MSGDDERGRFVDALGEILASWHLPRSTGRIYGALLLRDTPATFDELRDELGLSAGAVSTGVRELVSWGLAHTIPQPGSRRLLIEAAGGFEQLLAASHERTRAFIEVLRSGTRLVDGSVAAARLDDVSGLFEAYVDAGERMLASRGGRRSRAVE